MKFHLLTHKVSELLYLTFSNLVYRIYYSEKFLIKQDAQVVVYFSKDVV